MTLLKTNGLPSGLGYLEIDHRAADNAPVGLPKYFEADTYTCTHCSAVVVMNPARVRERYKCRGCNHHICDNCAADRISGGSCITMQQKYEQHMETIERNAQAAAKKRHEIFVGYSMEKNRLRSPEPQNSSIPLDNSGHLA